MLIGFRDATIAAFIAFPKVLAAVVAENIADFSKPMAVS